MGDEVSPPYPLAIRLWGLWGWILCIFSSTKRISDRPKHQKDQLHFDQLLEPQHILTLNQDKFGTVFNSASRITLYFWGDRPYKFGTVPKNSGRMVALVTQSIKGDGCWL